MKTPYEIAKKVYETLNKNGACLGNVSIHIIEEVIANEIVSTVLREREAENLDRIAYLESQLSRPTLLAADGACAHDELTFGNGNVEICGVCGVQIRPAAKA